MGWRDGERGELGKGGVYLSDLLGRALIESVTGNVYLALAEGEARLFFQRGAPIHASGTAVLRDFVGQILVERGLAETSVVEAAYTAQQTEAQAAPDARRPIGAVLAVNADVSTEDIRSAVETQLVRRVGWLAAQSDGRWTLSSGPTAEIAPIAAPVDGYALLAQVLRTNASDRELSDLSDALLGHAVRLTAPPATIAALKLDDEERAILDHLDRPRKVHQLELVSPRRRVRALLKALTVLGLLERLPADRGMPIKDAVRGIKGPSMAAAPPPPQQEEPSAPPPRAASNQPTPASRRPSRAESALLQDLRRVQAMIGKVTYYELLGVPRDAQAADIRTAYTLLAKKYHPDTMQTDDDEVSTLARGVVAGLNDAYTLLSDPERRGRYDQQLAAGHGLTEDAPGRAGGAKIKFEMAVVFLRRREYAKARDMLKQAMEIQPEHGLYKGTFAWALFADPAVERAEAISRASKLLEEATLASPREAALHYYYGRVLKERGDRELAEREFKATLAIEPKHKDAAMELRLIDMRKKDSDDPKPAGGGGAGKTGGVLSKLFKR